MNLKKCSRCTLVGGTNSSHAIEIGRCKFEARAEL